MTETTWHSLSIKETLEKLKSDVLGLPEDEIKKRQKEYGPNELPKKEPLTKLQILFSQFKSTLVYILIVAGVISIALGEIIDAQVIFFAVLINVIVGFIQENKAQNALLKLSEMVVLEVRVIRGGLEQIIKAKDLVPGDIIIIEAGDRITADARLVAAKELEVQEAALTGESCACQKQIEAIKKGTVLAERSNMVYTGTVIISGRGKAVVTEIGSNTQLGKIAGMIKEVKEEKTPLQKKLSIFSVRLGGFILFLAVLIFLAGIFSGQEFLVMFNTAVAVAVAAIPEGLVVAVTVILALGMRALVKKKALIRKLVAAETLGSTTVICTDKTGTLTIGEMRVSEVVTSSHDIDVIHDGSQLTKQSLVEGNLLIQIGMLVNDAVIQNEDQDLKNWQILGSGTDKALLLAGAQLGLKRKNLEKELKRLDEVPFESARRFMATLHEYDSRHNVIYFKGAPELILARASFVQQGDKPIKIYSDKRKELENKFVALSRKGLRVLGLGYVLVPEEIKDIDINNIFEFFKDIVIVGFMGIKDPLRETVRETLEETEKAGIRSVIITGDNAITAKTIARELDIEAESGNILEGSELLKMDDKKLEERVKDIKIYARVTPADKLRIVQAWQKKGEVVAMTGDGVNDAPALKQADVGISLGSGSDVTKETADLVLLDNSYQTILAAVEQGRVIYDNIKKVILYLLSDSFSEVILIFASLMFGLPLPLLPAQILWINIITDGFPDMALTMEPEEKEVMSEPPQEREKPILDFERRLLIGVISFVTAASTLAIFYYFWKVVGDLALARTVTFAALAVDSLFYVFSCRSLRHSIFHTHFFSNKYLLIAVVAGFGLQLMAIYAPFFQKVLRTVALGWAEWSIVLALSALVILVIEVIKWIFIVRHKS